MATVLEVRQALIDHGYVPIPLEGKIPLQKEWQKTENVSRAMLEMWAKTWPRANNTGILTKFTPTLDADIVIVNHHLLLADLALKEDGFGDILGTADAFASPAK